MLGARGGSSVEVAAVMASLDGEMSPSAGGGVVPGVLWLLRRRCRGRGLSGLRGIFSRGGDGRGDGGGLLGGILSA